MTAERTTPAERAARALVTRAEADSAIEDEILDEQWDTMLDACTVIGGVTQEVSGRPAVLAQVALTAALNDPDDPDFLARTLSDVLAVRVVWSSKRACESVAEALDIAVRTAILGADS